MLAENRQHKQITGGKEMTGNENEYLVQPDTTEWKRMWKELGERPINKDHNHSEACTFHGESWQYMGTFRNNKNFLHNFRHRYHPATNCREHVNIYANRFEWSSSSKTMRFMPGNYCVAIQITGHWLADIDGIFDESTAALIFTQIRNNQFQAGNVLEKILNDYAIEGHI